MEFTYSDGNKRYHSWNYALRNEFGGKISKCQSMEDLTAPIVMVQWLTGAVLFVVFLDQVI